MLNNRELASVIVLASALVLLCLGRDVRLSLGKVVVTTFGRKLTELWLLYGLSVAAAALWLDRVGLRYPGSVKDVVVWAVIAGLPIYVRFDGVQEHPEVLLSALLKAVRVTTLVEFFVNLYVFPLWVEIPMQVLLLGVVLLSAYANAEPSTPQVLRTFLARVLGFFGIVLLVWSAAHLVTGWHRVSWRDTALSLAQPIALTGVAVVVTGIVAVLAAHDTAWTRLEFPRGGLRPRLRHQLALFAGLHFRVTKLVRFNEQWAARLKSTSSFTAAFRVVRGYSRVGS